MCMKILWMVNAILPQIAESQGMKCFSGGGWLVQLANKLGSQNQIELTIIYPTYNDKVCYGKTDLFVYYGVPEKRIPERKYNKKREEQYRNIIAEVSPDIIHIWGSEYVHSLEIFRASKGIVRQVVSIQGLISRYEEFYFADLPISISYRMTFRDLIRMDNLYFQKRRYKQRGIFEIALIKEIKNVIGRTEWDYAICKHINPFVKYFTCGEILRESFYSAIWTYDKCEKNSIFVSQGNYPIKGLHHVLKALLILREKYPDIHIYVAGVCPYNDESFKGKLKISSYGKYIREYICSNQLEQYVSFLGDLNEAQMCEQYLKTNVFVMPSAIENSPNSLGEAMILGVPCVAANVGGIGSLLSHEKEGFLYQGNEYHMLAYYISRVLDERETMKSFSENSRIRAKEYHDVERNVTSYLNVYEKLTGGK